MTRARRRYDHVAFDLDGTLVDSRADLAAATNHVLRSFALPEIPPQSVFALVGEGARRLVERALGPERETLVDEGVARFLAFYEAHLLDATRLYPGVEDVLATLVRGGVVLSVLTNKPAGLSERIVRGLGVRASFCAIVGGDSLSTRKPDPAGLVMLCARSKTSADRTLLVGDSPIDVATAAAAGTAFCGVGWGLAPEPLRAARPRLLVEQPAALVPLVLGDPQPATTRS